MDSGKRKAEVDHIATNPQSSGSSKRVRMNFTNVDPEIHIQWQIGFLRKLPLAHPTLKISEEVATCLGNTQSLEDVIRSNVDSGLHMKMYENAAGTSQQAQETIDFFSGLLSSEQSLESISSHGETVPSQKKATEDAWLLGYVGNSHKLLLDRINTIATKEENSYYAHILPIVQSSGMGKSRAVHELSKLVFTIPICLRDSSDSNDTGYPYGDADLVNAFKTAFNQQYDEEVTPKSHCIKIFTCIFHAYRDELKKHSYSSPAKWCSRLQEKNDNGVTCRQRLYASAYAEYINDCKPHDAKLGPMQDALQELLELIGHMKKYQKGQGAKKVIVYIDECHFLTKETVVRNDRRKPLDFVSYALEECRRSGLFGIFLSTASQFSDLSVPSNVLPSAREVIVRQNSRPPPFVLFSFDLWNGKPIIMEGESTLHDVCQMSFLARFGRPLWWTRITELSGSINETMLQDLADFAAAKLIGSPSATVLSKPEVMFAVLSARLCIDLEPARESVGNMGQNLVANHLRIIYNIPDHKSFMRSGSSSEPVVAEASAGIWNNQTSLADRNVRFDPLKALTDVIEQGLLAKGERGELVARFILLRAQDIAISNMNLSNDTFFDRTAPFSRAVPLWSFFEALFNKEWLCPLAKKTPQNRNKGKGMEEACKNKYVRFNHFARAGDSAVVSTAAAWMAFARGNAWQCCTRQEAIDIIIPVFIKENDDSKLCRNTVTFILCQVKNTKTPKTVHFSAESESLQVFKDGIQRSDDIPYFVIIFNFGGPKTGSDLIPVTTSSHSNDPKPEGQPCYWLDVRGCSSQIYNPKICPEKLEALSNILSTSSLHEEVPKEFWEHIQHLKPNFGKEKGSFDWAEQTPGAVLGPVPDINN